MAAGDHLDPYRQALQQHGPSFEALLWNNKDFQRLRFAVLAQMTDLTGRVIVDVGCGMADLVPVLNELGIQYGRYVGVDGLPGLVDACAQRAADEGWDECRFETADFVTDEAFFARMVEDHGAEAFLFSGSLNTLEQADAQAALTRAWDAGPEAVAFNFLSTSWATVNEPGDPARRYDPAAMLAWALGTTKRVALRQDYLEGRDATVLMLRED